MLDQILEKQKEAMVSLSTGSHRDLLSASISSEGPRVHTWDSCHFHGLVQGQFRGCGEALCFGCFSCGCREALGELRSEAAVTSLQFSTENQDKKGPWLSQRSREHRQCLSILFCLSSVSSGNITESCPFYCPPGFDFVL